MDEEIKKLVVEWLKKNLEIALETEVQHCDDSRYEHLNISLSVGGEEVCSASVLLSIR